MKIHLIAAARPNFMKIAPLYHALKKESWSETLIIHTGQHYDINMSDTFFKDLELPDPDIHLGVGSGSHAEQTAKVMVAYEKVLIEKRPDLVIVVGDVNSTVACTLAASKIKYDVDSKFKIQNSKLLKNSNSKKLPALSFEPGRRPIVAHLEAGLRSFDRTMPEEINRIVTDALADILWTPSQDGDENLIHEGVHAGKIIRVGNIMIDSLEMLRSTIEKDSICDDLGLKKGEFCLVTMHRPSNVDNPEVLNGICNILINISKKRTILFPVHPRTRVNLIKSGLFNELAKSSNIILSEPLSYIKFMNLVFNCCFVITDSGGIQEETTYLGIPCLTMRPNTERPVTVTQGTNILCSIDNIEQNINNIATTASKKNNVPELWDGKTASRVVQSIKEILLKN